MRIKILGLGLALLSTIAFSAHGQSINLSGRWDLSAEAFLSQPAKGNGGNCQFVGNANISQLGDSFSGNAAMALVTGIQGCPAQMDARVDGTVANGAIQMSMLMGPLGTAQFDGRAPRQKGSPMGGGFSVVSGNFTGTTGTWAGTPSAQIVPTAGFWGLAALTLLLLVAGARMLRRRQTVSSR